jgi:hypothetical protein
MGVSTIWPSSEHAEEAGEDEGNHAGHHRGLCFDDELHVAVQHLQEPKERVDRIPVVRLIEESVELGGGRCRASG